MYISTSILYCFKKFVKHFLVCYSSYGDNMKVQIETQILNIKLCQTFFSRFIGMIGKKKKFKYGFYFPNCSSIHTFFMKQPIDVIFVNKNNQVISIHYHVKPWKIVHNKYAFACYEFSVGILKTVKIDTIISTL